nr:hypothetical protein CFP56_11027 [Quercus suber]
MTIGLASKDLPQDEGSAKPADARKQKTQTALQNETMMTRARECSRSARHTQAKGFPIQVHTMSATADERVVRPGLYLYNTYIHPTRRGRWESIPFDVPEKLEGKAVEGSEESMFLLSKLVPFLCKLRGRGNEGEAVQASCGVALCFLKIHDASVGRKRGELLWPNNVTIRAD